MSPNDDNPEEVKKAQKKYLWFGYGSYDNFGIQDPTGPANIRAAPSLFDKLFEIVGVKEKTSEKRPSEHKD